MSRSETKRASTRNVTIMFTDIKGFTARVSDGSRDDLAKLRADHDRLLLPVFKHFHGKVVKTIGDAFLVRFDSPTDAVLCGVTIQEVLRQHNAFVDDDKLRMNVRVAINTGDVDVSENDVMGEPVNIAARVEAIAEPGEVFFTEAVYLSMNRTEAPSAEVGEHTFKGIPYPVRVYKVAADADSALTRRLNEGVKLTDAGPLIRGFDPATPKANQGPFKLVAAGLIVAVAIITFLLLQPSDAAKAEATAIAAIENNDGATALSALENVLRNDPNHPDLKPLALKAAGIHIDHLRATIGYAKTKDWLSEQLRSKPYLASLRKQEVILEAQRIASTFVGTNNDPLPPLREMANQDTNDWEVPLAAAQILEGKVFPAAPLTLYQMALERGYVDKDERITQYCFRLFGHHTPSGAVRTGHVLLKEHFNEKRIAWAKAAYVTTYSGMILRNAESILKDTSDPLLNETWHVAIEDMLDGYESVDHADKALEYFKTQRDPIKRKRLVDLHRWVLDPPKGVGWYYQHKELIRRNLEALEKEWEMSAQ